MVWRSGFIAGTAQDARDASAAAARAPAAAGGADVPVGLAEISAILHRRWKVIATTTAIVTTLGGVFAMIAAPKYTATTAIFIDPRSRASFQIEGSGTGAGYDPNLVDSQTLVIESDAVLGRVLQAENLLSDPEFTRGPGEAASNALRNLKEALKVRRPDRTYVVEIQVRTGEAEKSARIANAIARAYLTDGRDSKSETAQREQTWLDTHLADLQKRLKNAETEVETYKKAHKILGVEGRLVGEQQLSELNRGIVEAQRRAAEAKAVLDQMEMLRKNGRLPDATTEALRSGAIERLRAQLAEVMRLDANSRSTLGPRHPASIEIREQITELRRLINEELTRIAESARAAFAVANANVAELGRQLDTLKRESTETNGKLLRLRELERAVEAQKAVYEKFLRDKEQIARLTVDTPAGRVIEPAVPPLYRSFPNRPLILALSFLGGLFLGIGIALTLETLAGGRRREGAPSPDSDRRENDPPGHVILLPPRSETAAVRWVGRPAGTARINTRPARSGSPVAYAREIRLLAQRTLDHLGGRRKGTLAMTGTGDPTARTRIAIHLAHALAARGINVLLVDGRGGAGSLTQLAGKRLPSATVLAEGMQRRARVLGRDGDGPYLVPFGAPLPRDEPAGQAAIECPVLLVDAAPDDLSIVRHADGVLVLTPSGSRDAMPEIAREAEARYGAALIGVVGQAA